MENKDKQIWVAEIKTSIPGKELVIITCDSKKSYDRLNVQINQIIDKYVEENTTKKKDILTEGND